MRVPPRFRSARFVFNAAGFIATSVSTSSPGVKMSWLEKLSWKPLTPARVPWGARISAGKSGSVLTSLPNDAETLVNCVPTNCIPSPLSPQNRMTTESRSSRRLSDDGAGPEFKTSVDDMGLWAPEGRQIPPTPQRQGPGKVPQSGSPPGHSDWNRRNKAGREVWEGLASGGGRERTLPMPNCRSDPESPQAEING